MKTKEQNHLEFLKELKSILEVTSYFSMSALCDKHKVGNEVIKALQDGKIIENQGQSGRGSVWKWKSNVLPNEKMAQELINRAIIIKRGYYETRKDKAQEEVTDKKDKKVIVEKPSPTKKISILWGLIKIEK